MGSSRVDSEACRHGSGKCIASSVPTPQAPASHSLAFPRVWAWVRQGGKSRGAQSLFTVCLDSSVFLPLCYFPNLSVFFLIPFLFFFPVSPFLSSLGRKLQLLSIVRFCWHMVQIWRDSRSSSVPVSSHTHWPKGPPRNWYCSCHRKVSTFSYIFFFFFFFFFVFIEVMCRNCRT